eukprot:TRINITY_DN2780_c0_g1_i1.p1 TRINITY_DN2780_c0_g1~~TRINITY_DN2780_c0_g1_i1.p1  ORF type:complete len:256 (-),score=53.61 TRINITY_DN2780_c0_g1_i1:99-866(-)
MMNRNMNSLLLNKEIGNLSAAKFVQKNRDEYMKKIGFEKAFALEDFDEEEEALVREMGSQAGLGNSRFFLRFNHEGDRLATSNSSKVQIWEHQSGKMIKQVNEHSEVVTSLSWFNRSNENYSKFDRYLYKNNVLLEDVSDDEEEDSIISNNNDYEEEDEEDRIENCQPIFSTASIDTTLKLWNKDYKVIHTFRDHKDWLRSVALTDSGRRMISGCVSANQFFFFFIGEDIRRIILFQDIYLLKTLLLKNYFCFSN